VFLKAKVPRTAVPNSLPEPPEVWRMTLPPKRR
jgi:hypothetical protein